MGKQIYLEADTPNDWVELENCEHAELPSYWNEIDMEVAGDSHCPKCGKSMTYRGFWNKERTRYKVAFAVCYDCNFATEF